METLYPTRLSSGQIRLLHILPSAIPESPISCELRQYEVDEVPAYEALSYCWGDSNDRREIICNGTTHLVTTSLRDALIRLRQANKARIIWADALCIAQFDDEEKSSQVRRMGSIYRRAKRVAVWLGHAEAEHLSSVKRLFESLVLVSGEPADYNSKWRVAEPESHRLFDDTSPWYSLQAFFSNPWFFRMWCIQEIRLASDSVFYWGNEEFPKDIAVRLPSWHRASQGGEEDYPFKIPSHFAWKMNAPLSSQKCRLLQALSTYRRWRATDPRDKVYGLLGLTELDEEKSVVPIDYEKSAAEVFYGVAVAIIKRTGDLAILAHLHHDTDYDGHPEYPSWVPRWDRSMSVPFDEMRAGLSPTSSAYGVCNSTAPHEITIQLSGRQLFVFGSIYVTVSFTTTFPEQQIHGLHKLEYVNMKDDEEQTLAYPVDVFLDYWQQLVSQEAPIDNDISPAMKSMARTLTGGALMRPSSYIGSSEEDVADYFRSFLDYIRLLHVLSEHSKAGWIIKYNFRRSGYG